MLVCSSLDSIGFAEERPNIVWIMSEDNSKHYLRHFDEGGAVTPVIEKMAEHGITFERAFSNSPVCSVARTTLITGCYAPRIGTQYHRRSRLAEMPKGLDMFPAYLRAAGYHTSNRAKEDYNAVKSSKPWDESGRQADWRNRPSEDMPFFHVRTFADSHESRLHFSQRDMETPTETDPDSIQLQPYFPDTPTFRYTRARYHDRMKIIDGHVATVLGELEQAGQLERTFVFYFGDHGGVLPRSKGYPYESGLHVPLVVRVPDQFRSLAGRELGSRTQGFVEFVDFGPTVLALAGVPIPDGVDGKAFLGGDVQPSEVDDRETAFGYADRFDEKTELIRTLRIGDWKYIRNFEAHLPDAMQNNYRYRMLAFQQWRQLHNAGELNDVQEAFFEAKPPEMLFDLKSDPHETNNLAGQRQYQTRLIEMRERLMRRLKTMPDLSFFPESVLYEWAMENPVGFGQSQSRQIAQYIDTANLALRPPGEAFEEIEERLDSDDPWQRWWALIAASQFSKHAARLDDKIRARLDDEEPQVIAQAAELLARIDDQFDPKPKLLQALAAAENDPEANRILGNAVYVKDFVDKRHAIDPDQIDWRYEVSKKDQSFRRLEYLGNR